MNKYHIDILERKELASYIFIAGINVPMQLLIRNLKNKNI